MLHSDDSYPGGPTFRTVPYNYLGGKPYALCENFLPGNTPFMDTSLPEGYKYRGKFKLACVSQIPSSCQQVQGAFFSGRPQLFYLFTNLLKKPN